MECQFGPRRKGVQPKKGSEQETNQNIFYKATCPARYTTYSWAKDNRFVLRTGSSLWNTHCNIWPFFRIYIKKVRKFLEYKVPTDPKVDKKVVRQEQEKAFFNLKKSLWDVGGVVRYKHLSITVKKNSYCKVHFTHLHSWQVLHPAPYWESPPVPWRGHCKPTSTSGADLLCGGRAKWRGRDRGAGQWIHAGCHDGGWDVLTLSTTPTRGREDLRVGGTRS